MEKDFSRQSIFPQKGAQFRQQRGQKLLVQRRIQRHVPAQRCGVTPTVVSAVLNHRNGTVCCSEEKRRLIEKTAAELQYRVNIMARSIVQQRIPIVALMFHKTQQRDKFTSRYFSVTASELNFQQLQYNLESLLAFYRSEEEQIERFQTLVRNGLVGGVISNLIPEHNAAFIRSLQASGIPHVLLGSPQLPAAAVRTEPGNLYPFVRRLLQHTQAKNGYLHRLLNGEHMLALCRAEIPPSGISGSRRNWPEIRKT